MYMRSQFIIILSFCIIGCSQGAKYHDAIYKETRRAAISQIGAPLELGVPVDLCQEGNFIFVLAYTPDSWLHIYDKNTGKKVSDCLLVGRGCGEGLNLVSMDYYPDKRILYIFDMVLRKTLAYQLDGEKGVARFDHEIQHPDGVIRKCHHLSGGRFLYEGYLIGDAKNTRFTLSDGSSAIDTYAQYPGITTEEDQYAFILGRCKLEPSTGRFVSGTLFGAVLECFNLASDTIHPIGVRLLDPPIMDMSGQTIQAKPGTKYGFSTFCFANNLIYAIYLDGLDANEFKTIASFDWNGREKIKYCTDQNILHLCPGERINEFYAITSSPEMEFSLSKINLQSQ